MKRYLLIIFFLIGSLPVAPASDTGDRFISENDLMWTSLGTNENDSVPLGNGDIAANVWTEQNGDLVLLVAKSDAWTETGKLVKLGRLRIRMNPKVTPASRTRDVVIFPAGKASVVSHK